MKGQGLPFLGAESSNDQNAKTYRDEKASPAVEPSANFQGLSVALVSSWRPCHENTYRGTEP